VAAIVSEEIEQAGGSASTGTSPVLDTAFESIHYRATFAVGSRNEVAMTAADLYRGVPNEA
jgi:fructose-1,6-bisphosphatase